MKILAIETSCDDTAMAEVEIKGKINPRFKVLSSLISSQTEIHKEWGGVYPSLAKREHQKNLPLVLENLKSKIQNSIDDIAVTVGPGLDPCLWTGIEFAKNLAEMQGLPIIPVNHIEAHILANFLEKKPKLPAIALIVSGGHTQLVLAKKIGKYELLGQTRDDAAGECFDKTARILGLGYPGGPAIAAAAARHVQNSRFKISLPRPMLNSKDFDFSFSGLKTAVLYDYKKREKKQTESQEYKSAMAKEIQQAVIDVLLKKTASAARRYEVKSIIAGGGVTANEELQKQFKKNFKNMFFPPKGLSTDNAVMIAVAAYYNKKKATKQYGKIKALPNLEIKC
mgnify:CR=1 FL=1